MHKLFHGLASGLPHYTHFPPPTWLPTNIPTGLLLDARQNTPRLFRIYIRPLVLLQMKNIDLAHRISFCVPNIDLAYSISVEHSKYRLW